MDIYGYQNYQCPYNQSDELANQMLAQQALAGSYPYNRTVSEGHIMPAPSGMPWNVQGLPWGLQSPPQLMQFSGQQPSPSTSTNNFSPVIHCKRKSLDVEPVIPSKQLITEEKMAAHLSSLHISSDFTTHSLGPEETMECNMDANLPVSERLKGHKIVLAEEIKKLKDEPLLPPSLLEKLEKPCMSLMVWKPKESIIEKINEHPKNEDEEKKGVIIEEIFDEPEPRKRNGVLVPEYANNDDMDIEL